LLFLSCVLAIVVIASAQYSAGPASGSYPTTGANVVPKNWNSVDCPSIWFNEYARALVNGYAADKGRNLTLFYGTPANTQVPTVTNFACDCGCGVWDPDCARPARSRDSNGDGDLTKTACSPKRADSATIDPRFTVCSALTGDCFNTDIPKTWSCEPTWYNEIATGASVDGTITCDCGCGAWDPDCDVSQADTTYPVLFSCGVYEPDIVQPDNVFCALSNNDPNLATYCKTVPFGWTCDPSLYDQSSSHLSTPVCDCHCGIWDPDCDSQADSPNSLDCGDGLDSKSRSFCFLGRESARCARVPQSWTCPPTRYAEKASQTAGVPVCDCGCGAWDPDCSSETPYNTYVDGFEVKFLANDVYQRCAPNREPKNDVPRSSCSKRDLTCKDVPAEWFCPTVWYDEITKGTGDGCDCNCGTWDPDCDHANVPLYCTPESQTSDSGNFYCKKYHYSPSDAGEDNLLVHTGVCRRRGSD